MCRVVDVASILKNEQLANIVAGASEKALNTQCSYIFPESTNAELDDAAKVLSYYPSLYHSDQLICSQARVCSKLLGDHQVLRFP